MNVFARLLCSLVAVAHVSAGGSTSIGLYHLTEKVVGRDFYSHFNWEAIEDPTHGRVNYVDQSTSIQQNLTQATFHSFILRADDTTVLDPAGPGRNSVRILSKRNYTTHVAVFDVRHMPQGCGTWPAIWETQITDWPTGGEIDIVEGVNDQSPNAATLHTTEGCTMPENRAETGTAGQNDCNYLVDSNTGCTVSFPGGLNYGPNFNANGGGWYAIERTNEHISVWFWPRNAWYVPLEVRLGSPLLTTSAWGVPAAYFPNTMCNIAKFFGVHHIVINLTLCGDWAGGAYPESGCPSTCVDYVNNNPAGFSGAYFDFASIRVYEP
ncbi:glycoside hydrolase family 16 protein [Hypholoma sublateritium FD-334 SS-4]|uniref:Glycoside hydrolase family 16 protein n=1 Tax=Hypholoma sublateritium (strain FD-334 SS-4) TaxID=945553 RepID=A0A0D2KLC6_HYPSF|nr:glycoside hydrolase family 16 protein [Hypholoma sublateritium FD-334 SS-4]